jgi:hypothetical protein
MSRINKGEVDEADWPLGVKTSKRYYMNEEQDEMFKKRE